MIAVILLFEVENGMILSFVPESIGLLIFGLALIASAVLTRRIFNKSEENNFERAAENANRRIIG
jgi:hypothetical protein